MVPMDYRDLLGKSGVNESSLLGSLSPARHWAPVGRSQDWNHLIAARSIPSGGIVVTAPSDSVGVDDSLSHHADRDGMRAYDSRAAPLGRPDLFSLDCSTRTKATRRISS